MEKIERLKEIEGILYLASELKIMELAKFYNVGFEEAKGYLEELSKEKEDNGVNVKIKGEYAYLETNPQYGERIHNFFNQESKPKKLSRAAMETLSIIAYKQPITKGQIEEIRGVSVERVVHNLEEKNLVEVCGKLESIGRANQYGTTKNFLNYLNITKLEDLPEYENIKMQNLKGDEEKNGKDEVK